MSAIFIISLIIIIAFSATLFRSTFGFGEALIAVPLLSLFLPIGMAVSLAVMMSILVALVVVIHDHSKIHFHSAKWLILYAFLGIPVGLFILSYGNEAIVKIILGLIIILYAIYSLVGKNTIKLEKDSKIWLFVCGFLSGVLGGAYGANGPPLVVYGNLRQWDAQHFRATLQAYFLPAGLFSMIGYVSEGLINAQILLYFLYSIPVIIFAVFIGRYLNKKIKGNAFYKYVYCGLILIGVVMILNSLFL
ncbi:sulfite exporter TauE/SafE family protein [Prevotella sp. 10(H)]|uniref:sulfite exporter TauE/SafE family protein n=1 Tax=Prevotella sp. 10(H) TaxID=1158294 RepID=UPI0004A737CA|nr:sulfite exporter TauE/SafE family protein [Prevotella sp. 10(H)]